MMNITNVSAYIQAHVHVFGYIESGALFQIFGLMPERALREIKACKGDLGITYNRRERAWLGKPTSDRDTFSAAWRRLTAVDSMPWPLSTACPALNAAPGWHGWVAVVSTGGKNDG